MRLLFFVILFVVFTSDLKSQSTDRYPFKTGEEISYDVYYNLAFVWVNAADVRFLVQDSLVKNENVFFFQSFGTSKPSYDWIFTVRDTFEVIVEKKYFRPILYKRNTREGSSFAKNYYLFDYQKELIYSRINNNKSFFSDTLIQRDEVRDVLSSVYYLRKLDLDNYLLWDTISITSVMDNELIDLDIVYCGKETIEHRNGELYKTHKLKTNGVEGSIFNSDSEIFVWVSDDDNKIPIKIESEILVGSVQAYLRSVRKPKVKQSNIIQKFLQD